MKSPRTLVEFMNKFGSEEACRQALFEHRWPEGFVCPSCGEGHAYKIKRRGLYECASCGRQTSLTAGTIFHKSSTPLQKWLLAIYLMAATKKAPSAAELSRQLGIAPQTAWTIRRKIVSAMARREGELMLAGIVEMDESYVGGRSSHSRGRRAGGKAIVAVMAEVTGSGGLGLAHMTVIPSASASSLGIAAGSVVSEGSMLRTDGWGPYQGVVSDLDLDHDATVQGDPKNASEILPWVHVVISNFKRWISGIFHGVSPKHLQSYLDEFCYRLNRRYRRTDLFRRVLNRCCRFHGPVTYAELIAT